jgi:signal transduction histidine kinase
MTSRPDSMQIFKADLTPRYEKVLRGYLKDAAEEDLVKAYELGRKGFAQDIGILEMVSLHHRALAGVSSESSHEDEVQRVAKLSGQFLTEVFSAYELGRRSYQDTVLSLRHLNELLEQEVKRIAHSVHDEAGQLLVAAHLAIADVICGATPEMRERLRQVVRLLDQAERHLRQFSHELRPTVLDDLGLVPALRFLAGGISKRTGLPIRVTSSLNGRLPSAIEIGLYRAVQEALTNVTKHSRARSVTIELRRKRGTILCTVEDDGVGFNPDAALSRNGKKGLGLIGIQERLNVLKGAFHIESRTGRGTKLFFRVPLGG